MNVNAESGTADDAMNDTSDSLQQEYGPSNRWWLLSLVAMAYFVLIQHRLVIGYVQVFPFKKVREEAEKKLQVAERRKIPHLLELLLK